VNTCTRRFRRHALRIGAAVSLAGLLSATTIGSALADTVSDKRSQAQALASQIDALGNKEAALSEQYDKAILGTQTTGAQVQQAQAALATAQANASRVRGALQAEAVDSYMHGGTLAAVASRNGPTGVTNTVLRGVYVKTLAGSQTDALDAFRLAAAQENEAKDALIEAQLAQNQSLAQVDAARKATIAAEQTLTAALSKVKGDIATLVAQAQAAKAAADAQVAAAAAARQTSSRSTSVGAFSSTPIPVGAGAGEAVAAARSRLGAPYQWGAAGPNAFDCSGLTMWAWSQAGISLPHFSGAQYSQTQHIPISQVQPGDLVFPSNPGQHVAIYIGGGQIIAAPHTGTVVQIQPLSSWYTLASRP
jgi:cell wall-associated NlpC family hydrolase